MNFQQSLSGLKIAIDKEIGHYFDVAISQAQKEDELLAEALVHARKIALSGGKRIRGALTMQAYFGLGGVEKKKILKVAAAIELVHLFLLVHDDIIDRGDLRHGQKTLHEMLAKKYQKNLSQVEAQHFGNSIAIIVGDMLYVIANRIILEAGFSPEISSSALLQLQKVVATTIIGQSQDIAIEYKNNVSIDEVLAMYANKTARYTFEGPLNLGAILAGCGDKKIFNQFNKLALSLGIAFQTQDDILGVFGEMNKIGKSVASDIEEGKQSLLVVKARELSSLQQKKKIDALLGKKNITQKEAAVFQDILKETGALQYSQELAKGYLQDSKKEIGKLIVKKDCRDFLLGAVEYLEHREV